MSRLLAYLLFIFLCASTVIASKEVAIKSPRESFPCYVVCAYQSLAEVNCSTSDIQCRCTNKRVNSLISNCIVANCSLEDALDAAKSWANQCDEPHNNHNSALRAAAVGSGVAGTCIVIFRVIARLYTEQRLWWDDWSHIIAGIFTIALTIFSNLCITDGLGYHLYDIEYSSLSQIRDLIIWYYLCEIFWLLVIYFIKISILFLYIRIFPELPKFRYYVIGTMIFVTLSVVILTPMAIWQCVPISAIWSFNRGDARCLSISGVAYASAAVNIATEVIILILPVPLLRTLRTSTTQKIALYMLFGCGIIVIAVASARIPSLSHVEDTHDPTFLNAGVVYWTAAETAVAHLCAAALAIRPLYVSLRDLLRRRRARTDSGTPFTKPPGDSLPQSHSRAGSSSHEEHRLQGGDFEDTVFNPTQKLEADAV